MVSNILFYLILVTLIVIDATEEAQRVTYELSKYPLELPERCTNCQDEHERAFDSITRHHHTSCLDIVVGGPWEWFILYVLRNGMRKSSWNSSEGNLMLTAVPYSLGL